MPATAKSGSRLLIYEVKYLRHPFTLPRLVAGESLLLFSRLSIFGVFKNASQYVQTKEANRGFAELMNTAKNENNR